jgi:gentisate 1,2-dioxygenase
MKPGQTIPFHKHDNAEEILFVEEGGATVIVGDQRAVAGPRSIVFIPRDTWISATNTGKQDIHLLALFSRHGYEQYMRALGVKQGEPMNPLSPDELTRLRALGHSMYWDTSKRSVPTRRSASLRPVDRAPLQRTQRATSRSALGRNGRQTGTYVEPAQERQCGNPTTAFIPQRFPPWNGPMVRLVW